MLEIMESIFNQGLVQKYTAEIQDSWARSFRKSNTIISSDLVKLTLMV